MTPRDARPATIPYAAPAASHANKVWAAVAILLAGLHALFRIVRA